MKRSAAALAVAALGLASLSGVEAVYCAYATGSCTVSPCPGSTLEEWGTCILSDPADCPRGCVLYPNAQNGQPGICGLSGGSFEEITNQQLRSIQDCLQNITPTCIISNLDLLAGLGCDNCVQDLQELQTLNTECESINNEARCEETWVPCPGEPEEPPSEMAPEMVPMMGPMMAPAPGMMAPTAATTPAGVPAAAPAGSGTSRATSGGGGGGSSSNDNGSQAESGGNNGNGAPSMKALVAMAASAACAAALL